MENNIYTNEMITLFQELKQADYDYYMKDNPKISDKEYDEKKRLLINLEIKEQLHLK